MLKKIIPILCLLGYNNIANSTTYYVSNKGSDINTGTSIALPLKTINQGISKATMPNDIVYVLSGIYIENIILDKTGITVSALEGNFPIIDGNNTLPVISSDSLISIIGNNNTFSGFEIKNSKGYGITLDGNFNTISKNNIHHIYETGIIIKNDNSIIEDNVVYKSALHNQKTNFTEEVYSNGISTAKNTLNGVVLGIVSNSIIRRNTVYNNYGEGILLSESNNSIVENNTLYDNWTSDILLSDTTYSYIRGNLTYNSSASDIVYKGNVKPNTLTLSDNNPIKPRSSSNKIYNNVSYNGNWSLFYPTNVSGYGLNNTLIANNTIVDGKISTPIVSDVSVNSRIINNIFSTPLISIIPAKVGITFSNNNWSVNPPTNAIVSTNLIGDAKLSKTGTTTAGALTKLYFKLNSGSGVINRGLTLVDFNTDIFDTVRGDSGYDIGAHEYVVSTSNPQPLCRMICTIP